MPFKTADGIANSVDSASLEQSDLGHHCLLKNFWSNNLGAPSGCYCLISISTITEFYF